MSAHRARMPICLAAIVLAGVSISNTSFIIKPVDYRFCVVLFEAVKALLMINMRTIQQTHWLALQTEVADGAVFVASL